MKPTQMDASAGPLAQWPDISRGKIRMRAFAFALLLAMALPVAARAAEPAPAPDPVVRAQLDKLEYKYDVDEDGDFKLTFSAEGDRTQLVFVRSRVESFGSHRVREIWSPAYLAEQDQFPADIANKLLDASQDSKMGAWVKQGRYAVFVVKLPADAGSEQLDDAIQAAVRSADEMEASLTPGKDAY
jgi:hypothetical protein